MQQKHCIKQYLNYVDHTKILITSTSTFSETIDLIKSYFLSFHSEIINWLEREKIGKNNMASLYNAWGGLNQHVTVLTIL